MAQRSTNATEDLMENIKANYQSVILGLIVFLIAMVAIYRAIGNRQKAREAKQETAATTETSETPTTAPITTAEYVVSKGDTLWKIAERKYGSGYNWVDVAKVNKLKNAGKIEKGQKLTLPDVKPRKLTAGTVSQKKMATGRVTITGDSYQVQKGDYLWKIAKGAYGDGFGWVKIARANKLRNPGLIYAGQTLQIPR